VRNKETTAIQGASKYSRKALRGLAQASTHILLISFSIGLLPSTPHCANHCFQHTHPSYWDSNALDSPIVCDFSSRITFGTTNSFHASRKRVDRSSDPTALSRLGTSPSKSMLTLCDGPVGTSCPSWYGNETECGGAWATGGKRANVGTGGP
jgi:hypothetical protein